MPHAVDRPPKIILDTDFGGDIDDLGALAVLHALADQGRCEIAGIISDTNQSHAVSAIDAVNRWAGRPGIPIGRPDHLNVQDTYSNAVGALCPEAMPGEQAPLAVPLYRQLLAEATDQSVVIATIGIFSLLRDLLASGPDAISSLSGVELVHRAVRRIVVMGGEYPSRSGRPETNFCSWNRTGTTRYVVENSPVPMVFCGFEVGAKQNGYGTGERLNDLPDGHPVKVGYQHFFAQPPSWVGDGPWETIQPWSIWDQITVYHAVCNDQDLFAETPGKNEVFDDGSNTFHEHPDGPHRYIRPRVSPQELAQSTIEPLMLVER